MNNDIFSKFNLEKLSPQVKFVNPIEDQMKRMKQIQDEALMSIAEEKQKGERYNYEVLETLKKIEKNTGDITAIVSLVQNSNEKQDEILNVLKKIMEISQAKSEEEADDLYRTVMDEANQLNEDIETASKLIGFGKIVWLAVKEYIKIHS